MPSVDVDQAQDDAIRLAGLMAKKIIKACDKKVGHDLSGPDIVCTLAPTILAYLVNDDPVDLPRKVHAIEQCVRALSRDAIINRHHYNSKMSSAGNKHAHQIMMSKDMCDNMLFEVRRMMDIMAPMADQTIMLSKTDPQLSLDTAQEPEGRPARPRSFP